MDTGHPNVSCHFESARTLQLLERYYWWPDMKQSTR